MRNVYRFLVLILALSAFGCAGTQDLLEPWEPSDKIVIVPYTASTNLTDENDPAMCTAMFTMAYYQEEDDRQLAEYYDILGRLIEWEQVQTINDFTEYNKRTKKYMKDMDTATALLYWHRCVTRAVDIYPKFMQSQ